MARTKQAYTQGDLVYPYGRPVKVGRVIRAQGGLIYIMDKKGVKTYSPLELRDFDALIADHEKKLRTLRGYVAELPAWGGA